MHAMPRATWPLGSSQTRFLGQIGRVGGIGRQSLIFRAFPKDLTFLQHPNSLPVYPLMAGVQPLVRWFHFLPGLCMMPHLYSIYSGERVPANRFRWFVFRLLSLWLHSIVVERKPPCSPFQMSLWSLVRALNAQEPRDGRNFQRCDPAMLSDP